MIELFEHNRKAYDSAVKMLVETGKAAVIHPTGTGKSFIGFKLCEDNPDKNVCWLSPSEYIFKTQTENLKEESDGYFPENVSFFTYAKLTVAYVGSSVHSDSAVTLAPYLNPHSVEYGLVCLVSVVHVLSPFWFFEIKKAE